VAWQSRPLSSEEQEALADQRRRLEQAKAAVADVEFPVPLPCAPRQAKALQSNAHQELASRPAASRHAFYAHAEHDFAKQQRQNRRNFMKTRGRGQGRAPPPTPSRKACRQPPDLSEAEKLQFRTCDAQGRVIVGLFGAGADSCSRLQRRTATRQVFVKSVGGKTVVVSFPAPGLVADIKRAVEAKDGTPRDQQRLIFAGKQLEDDRTLEDYGILDDSTLHCLLRLRGGAPRKSLAEHWQATEAQLTPQQLACVAMEADSPWGGPWGKCVLCQLWADQSHFNSQHHARKVATHGAASCVDQAVSVAAHAAQVQPTSVAENATIRQFWPTMRTSEPAQGAILIDSFHYFKEKNSARGRAKYEYYLPRLLQQIWQTTGKVFTAICSGGAALANVHGQGARFEQLLAQAPCGLEALIAIICGNDFLQGAAVAKYSCTWERAAAALVQGMKAKSVSQVAVVGGSAGTWAYDWMPKDQQAAYDSHARRLCHFFSQCGVEATTGEHHLAGICTSDRIGHVDPCSEHIVFAAYQAWVARALGAVADVPLPPTTPVQGAAFERLGPAQPPPRNLPPNWVAIWSSEHSAYCYRHSAPGFAEETTWLEPPEVPAPWHVFWLEADAMFAYWHQVWDCYVAEPPPSLPEPWELGWDAAEQVHTYWNPHLQVFCRDPDGTPLRPVVMPTIIGGYTAFYDDEGKVAYRHEATGEITYEFSPPTPPGWLVRWSVAKQAWYWRCTATGQVEEDFPGSDEPAQPERHHDVSALAAHLQALCLAGHVTANGAPTLADLRRQYRRFLLRCHPDKMPGPAAEEKFAEHRLQFEELLAALADGVDLDTLMPSRASEPLLALCDAPASADKAHGLDPHEGSGRADKVQGLLSAQREWGFVDLVRYEFAALADQLQSQAFVDSPADFYESLHDGWWTGMPWRLVAKALHVQSRLFLSDGWALPLCFFKHLVEEALLRHDAAAPAPANGEELQRTLFDGWPQLRKKLQKVRMRSCVVCGVRPTTAYRPSTRPGSERPPLSEIYCRGCFEMRGDLGAASQMLEKSAVDASEAAATNALQAEPTCAGDSTRRQCPHRARRACRGRGR